MFELYYKKNDNNTLFTSFSKIGITKVQNYIPLYQQFFSLKTTNYKNLNLNHVFHVNNIEKTDKRNVFICDIVSDAISKSVSNVNNKTVANIKPKAESKIESKKRCFFKFSPLLDPVKFMTGKYKSLGKIKRMTLPELENNTCHKKVLDPNNAAYVDGFFSYLISQLYHTYYFPHGLDYFGSFLGIQEQFYMNIADDIEYLHDSTYFHKNKNTLFELDDIDISMLVNFDTRNYKTKLNIGNNVSNTNVDTLAHEQYNNVFHLTDISNGKLTCAPDLIFDFKLSISGSNRTNSTCSSRSSNTSLESNATINTTGTCGHGNSSSSSSSNNSSDDSYSSLNTDIEVNCIIYDFPIQVICLEYMDGTLDSLLNDEMNCDEWRACLFQIVMTLIVYQKVFDFTHNDLHTNNIMFSKTEKQFLYYRYNQKYYKVPTYGKIFKIIDFGRAIYKYKGKTICSDSYHRSGDAATQYNFEPYFNSKKPRLEPNPSFDICRLACSLFDFFIDDLDNIDPMDTLAKMMVQWTKDDKGRNILYKKNGEDRYPEFKLYKMIARTVHNHTPQAQLNEPFFNKFVISRKKISKKTKFVDIDKMPVLCDP